MGFKTAVTLKKVVTLTGVAVAFFVVFLGFVACGSSEEPPQIGLASDLSESGYPEVPFSLDTKDISGSTRTGWLWAPPSREQVGELAQLAGVSGAIQDEPDGGWLVRDEDANQVLYVQPQGIWTAAPLQNVSDEFLSCTETAGDDETALDQCGEQEYERKASSRFSPPPDEVVNETTKTLFGDKVDYGVGVQKTEVSVGVEVDYLFDGKKSGLRGSYFVYPAVKEGSDYSWEAFGLLGEPRPLGRYRTLSAKDALKRAGDPRFAQVAGRDSGALSDRSTQMVEVKEVLVGYFEPSGTPLALPGYEFKDNKGGVWTVVAVERSYFNEVPQEDPLEERDPTVPADDTGEVFTDLYGTSEQEFVDVVSGFGFSVRVVEKDGVFFDMSGDYDLERLNIVVVGGEVVSAFVG